jgi:outer membrane protein assembly factor BamA
MHKHLNSRFLIVLLAFSSPAPYAADAAPERSGKTERRTVVAPLVVSNPSFGNGGGVSALYFYRPDDAGDGPPSFVGLTGAYSDTDSYFLGLGVQSFRRDDTFRLSYGGAYGHIENELDVDGLPEVRFQTEVAAASLRTQWRVRGNLFLGVKASVVDVQYTPGNEASRAYFQQFGVEDSFAGSTGAVTTYDSRDNTRYPHSGSLSEVSLTTHPHWLGGDDSYFVASAETNRFLPVGDRKVLALRGYWRFTPGGTPFSGLSTLGRRSDLRGYTSGEHVARNLLSTQAEYRWMLNDRWGLVGFFGVARLYDGGIHEGENFSSGGVGVRLRLHQANRVNLRVDFAWGEDDEDGFYVSLREAF